MTCREAPGGVSTRPKGSRSAKLGGVGAALLGTLLWQGFAPGQERDCKLVKVGGYTDSRRQDSVNYMHRASGGIDYRCTDGTRILADSAVVWERSGNVFFFGNVHFEDPDTELEADSARYFDVTQELVAYSNVMLTDRKGGAVIRGDLLNYLTESRFREVDRILVSKGSPRATIYPARRPAASVAVAEAVEDSTDEAEILPGETAEEDPAGDSLAAETEPVSDSAAGAAQDPGEDSLLVRMGDPLIDSLAGVTSGIPPSVGRVDEIPELARLDSLLGISPEPSAEAEAAATDVLVDSVTPLPYEVEAPRIMIDGRRFFRAGGGVVMTRDSLRAIGDSLDYDQEVGAMLILGDASVEDRGFRLEGRSVSVTPTAGLNEEILAREEAELTGDEVLMTAPAIRLFLEDSKVSRLVALPTVPPLPDDGGAEALDTEGLTPGDAERVRAMAEAAAAAAAAEDSLKAPDSLPRPSVVAAEFNLTGDSIEVLSPNQLLDVVTAIGTARADAMDQNSLFSDGLPEIARNDWMEGETIIAQFVMAESEGDTAAADPGPAGRRAQLETLTAIDDARSLYRLYRSDTTQADTDTNGVEPVAAPDEPVLFAEEPPVPPEDSATAPDEPDPTPEESDQSAEECDTTRADGEGPPELHYVSGNQITIFLEGRKVVKMEVKGQTQGYHFEPLPPDCGSAAGDSATAADSATAPPDTATPSVPDGIPPLAAGEEAIVVADSPTDVTTSSTLSGRGLTKIYKKRRVVSEVDIEVRQREIVALLGPNGAGKTTTFYMLVGLIGPNGGRVFLDDTELTSVPMYKRARMGVGYLAQEPSVFRRLTVAQNVMAILETLDLTRKERAERLEGLLAELSIGHLRHAKAFSLSGGERRRLEITRALVQRPKFMLLDEPFAGIDPIALHDIQEIVAELKNRNIGVIISDHNVEQTLEIVDRAYIMYEGRIRVSGTVSELVWNDEVADLYLGPSLTARMRSRFPPPGQYPRTAERR